MYSTVQISRKFRATSREKYALQGISKTFSFAFYPRERNWSESSNARGRKKYPSISHSLIPSFISFSLRRVNLSLVLSAAGNVNVLGHFSRSLSPLPRTLKERGATLIRCGEVG